MRVVQSSERIGSNAKSLGLFSRSGGRSGRGAVGSPADRFESPPVYPKLDQVVLVVNGDDER